MAENYITRLKRENEEKDAKLAELEAKVAEIKSNQAVATPQEVVETPTDDRDEIIPVWIERIGVDAENRPVFKKHEMPKRAALEALVEHYINRKNKAVPSPSDYTDMNNTTVYARITKRDLSTGRKMTIIKDLPLWIAAERAIEGKVVELVTKQEYEKFYQDRAGKEESWKKEYYEQKRQQALEVLINSK